MKYPEIVELILNLDRRLRELEEKVIYMTMSKKNYEEIAKIINKNTYVQSLDGYQHLSKEEIIQELCDYFKIDNPNFNASKFKEACSV